MACRKDYGLMGRDGNKIGFPKYRASFVPDYILKMEFIHVIKWKWKWHGWKLGSFSVVHLNTTVYYYCVSVQSAYTFCFSETGAHSFEYCCKMLLEWLSLRLVGLPLLFCSLSRFRLSNLAWIVCHYYLHSQCGNMFWYGEKRLRISLTNKRMLHFIGIQVSHIEFSTSLGNKRHIGLLHLLCE